MIALTMALALASPLGAPKSTGPVSALLAGPEHLKTPAPTPRQCEVMAAVARAEPFWGAGRAPVARAWNDDGELTTDCPWPRLGLRPPEVVGIQGGPIFWFSAPRFEAVERARVVYALTEPGPPPRTTFHLCRLRRADTRWRLVAPCSTIASRPAQ